MSRSRKAGSRARHRPFRPVSGDHRSSSPTWHSSVSVTKRPACAACLNHSTSPVGRTQPSSPAVRAASEPCVAVAAWCHLILSGEFSLAIACVPHGLRAECLTSVSWRQVPTPVRWLPLRPYFARLSSKSVVSRESRGHATAGSLV